MKGKNPIPMKACDPEFKPKGRTVSQSKSSDRRAKHKTAEAINK